MKNSSKAIVRALIAIALMSAMLAIAPASAGASGSPSSGAGGSPSSGQGGHGHNGQNGHVWVSGHGGWHGHHKPYPLPAKGSDHCGKQQWNCKADRSDTPDKPSSDVPSWCTDTSPYLHLSDISEVECNKLLAGDKTDHFEKSQDGKSGRHHMNRRFTAL